MDRRFRVTRSSLSGTVREELKGVLGEGVVFDEPLSRHCSMGTGGAADAFCTVPGREALRRLLELLSVRDLRWMMIGHGTNVLPADLGFRGAVVKLAGEFGGVVRDGRFLSAGAAAPLAELVEESRAGELGGAEFLTGIPGCVGGSLPGNAGTAADSLGDVVERVDVVLPGGGERRLGRDEMEFSYRRSNLREMGAIVLEARMVLEPRPRAEIAERIRTCAERRKGQPVGLPNVGCIFKNPPGDSAGRLIDAAGLKGVRSGGAEVSRRHANFIVNTGGASSSDVVGLIREVREKVLAETGVRLESEIVVVGETGEAAEC